MANFDTSIENRASVQKANVILGNIQSAYQAMKVVQTFMAIYEGNENPLFNTTFESLFSSDERDEINDILDGINTLVEDWETNHFGALQG